MPTAAETSPMGVLIQCVDDGFNRRSWHGPNLRGSLRGVAVQAAVWRPAPDRHCIAEHALHAAYWKYVVRRRILGDKRGSFRLPGSNWFPLADPWTERAWRDCLKLLEGEHDLLRSAVASLPVAELDRRRGGTTTNRQLIMGIAFHDVYHAGQIQLIRRMMA